ncbi:MAG: S9 family peptidase [Mediterranea sp.]|jgi:dipeptidyl-peptidase-4|nr:S9 family peptidase [Mediterranea sp.]
MNSIGKKAMAALLMALPLGMTIMAQGNRTPTLEELIPGGDSYRYAENIYGLQWWNDECVWPGIDTIYTVHPQTGEKSMLVTRAQVNLALEARSLGKLSHLQSVRFLWPDKPQMLLTLPERYMVYDFRENKVTSVRAMPRQAANKDYCAENGSVAYTIGNNLYIDGRAVTKEPDGIVCGQSVHRNEFGIHKGTFWSPRGRRLAFYRMDESMVAQYPLVDITATIGALNNIRYPMAGMTSHKVSVGIYNIATEKVVYLDTGDPTNRYFTNISWSPDGESLFLIELNRDQNDALLCQYDAQTGKLMRTVYEERHPKYVEPQHPIAFLPWDSSRFIYQSQQDGYNHLYVFDTKKRRMTRLTEGPWLVSELLGFNAARKEVVFTAMNGMRSGHFSVKVDNGKMNRPFASCAESVHGGLLSPSGQYLIDRYSTKTEPRVIDIVDTRNFRHVNLLTAKDPYAGYLMPSIETGTIKAADGVTDLNYRLVKPANFDPARKYPVIVYVYGGPHAQMVTGGWQNGARGWDIYMAGKGYIMFTLDNRGSSGRGLAFENVTFRHLGVEEGKDQVEGVKFLRSLPYVDADRIGVHGWSFGGHMTTALMLRYPDLYKVGVAGGPVIDWAYYEVMYGERYMDTPQSNPAGYEECDLKNLAGQLKGHLLLIHDDHDDTCVPQHTLSFIKACVDARTYPDLFIYPGHKHNVAGRDRVHLHEKITRYFEQYL